jgi:hypothetical protein
MTIYLALIKEINIFSLLDFRTIKKNRGRMPLFL